MRSPPFNRLGGLALLLFSPLLAFGLGFTFAYQQDQLRVSELGRIAWLHFQYAEELKDDMAVIASHPWREAPASEEVQDRLISPLFIHHI